MKKYKLELELDQSEFAEVYMLSMILTPVTFALPEHLDSLCKKLNSACELTIDNELKMFMDKLLMAHNKIMDTTSTKNPLNMGAYMIKLRETVDPFLTEKEKKKYTLPKYD